MATSRLQFSCNRTNRRAMRRLVSLPPWRCCFVIYAQVSSTFAWLFTRLPDENSSGHGRDSSADRSPANGRNRGRHDQLSPFFLGNVACLYYQQVYSRPQANGPAFLMTISSLLGCGLCTGVLSEVFRYLLPGEGTALASVSGAGTTSQLQKVVLDPISGHDLSRHADPVSSVYCNPTATWVGNLLKIIEEFLSSPDPPAALWRHLLGHLSSLTLLVKGGILWMRSV